MGPSVERDAYVAGYQSGFCKRKPDWESVYYNSGWHIGEEKGYRSLFSAQYDKGRKDGQAKLAEVENMLQDKLGEIALEDEQLVLDEYLTHLFDTFYHTSYIFRSWDDRLLEELFPSLEGDWMGNSIWDMIHGRNMQKALKYLKCTTLNRQQPFLYYQVLAVDKQLQCIRKDGKLGNISRYDLKYQYDLINASLAKLAEAIIGKEKS